MFDWILLIQITGGHYPLLDVLKAMLIWVENKAIKREDIYSPL
jgi:hypothetical protein